MYSTPMDTIHAEFDESIKPDDYLAQYVFQNSNVYLLKDDFLERVEYQLERRVDKN